MSNLRKLFDSPYNTIKKLSVIAFYICLAFGTITLLVGIINMIKVIADTGNSFFEFMSYSLADAMTVDWRAEGYAAKNQILQGVYIMLASLATIPLYGFGCIIEDVAAIKKATMKEVN